MSKTRQVVTLAAGLYGMRLAVAYYGYARRDPMCLLSLRPGRVDPYRIYRKLRQGGPLVPTRLGNWVSTSHRICHQVLRGRGFGVQPADAPVVSHPESFGMSFLEMNPPDHTRLRRLAQPAFSPRRMAGYRSRVESTVDGLLDAATTAGRFDLVGGLAAPLPIAVITDLLGVPDPDLATFTRYGTVIGGALDGIRSLPQVSRLRTANAELTRLFDGLFALRRREPADDIVSQVVAAEGDQVKPAEMFPLCVLLLVAGFETTVNLIGNAVNALLDHPDQWEALRADPETMAPKAVEETLRYDPPVQRTGRFALEDTELDGHPVYKGQYVVTLLGAANRDPEAHPDPDTFDITRDQTTDHLAFSSGIHYCVGQPLALLEATTALRVLAERVPHLHRAGPTRRRNSTLIRGPIHLPVRTTAA